TRMHIVNLSLGNIPNPDNFSLASYNAAYEHVGSFLRRRYGTLLVAAAGNRGGRPVSNPARCPSYLAVGAIDNQRRLAPYSSIGYQVELCAPGSSILSTFPPDTYRTLSGTSMAAPHVTGVAALVKSRWPAMHGDSIRVRMNQRAIDLGWPGRDWAWGYGQVHALRSVQ
ncbi:MAG: S8 family serine peptidase, partial [Bacteroidota bacterium]